MVGRIWKARLRTTSRYTRATSTGLGSVFVMKLIRFWMEGKILIFPNSGGAVLEGVRRTPGVQRGRTHYAEDGFVNDSESKPQSQKL